MNRLAAIAGLALILASAQAHEQSIDSDRDGASDELEQQLIQRFAPSFRLSASDCDQLPSEFHPDSLKPRALAKNGTIYAQVFPVRRTLGDGAFVEIHYYHLWSSDCGRIRHNLDAEHISALVGATALDAPPKDWRALYWYAAAHEDTVCDTSNGAKAAAIGAVDRGPTVWISHGKHASYLSEHLCRRGCGGDRCAETIPLVVRQIVNVGELGSPMAGAGWTSSPAWPLSEKMAADFNGSILDRLANSGTTGIVSLNASHIAVQSVVLVGGATADGLSTSNRRTGAALVTAEKHTDGALTTSYSKVDRSLRKAQRATKNWLRRAW